MNHPSDEDSVPTEKTDFPTAYSNFSAPTAEMKRRNRLTGLLFFALVLLFLSISIWRRFFS